MRERMRARVRRILAVPGRAVLRLFVGITVYDAGAVRDADGLGAPRRRRGTRLPAGGAVLASNHPNYLDGPLMMLLDARVRAVAKPQPGPVVGTALRWSGSFVIGRAAERAAVAHLRGGGLVWLAPEGRRTGERLGPLRRGGARMAAVAGVPLVPVAIRYRDARGAPEPPGPIGTVGPRLRDWRPWRRPHVEVVLGAPLWPRPDSVAEDTAQLRGRISAMAAIPLDGGDGGRSAQ